MEQSINIGEIAELGTDIHLFSINYGDGKGKAKFFRNVVNVWILESYAETFLIKST